MLNECRICPKLRTDCRYKRDDRIPLEETLSTLDNDAAFKLWADQSGEQSACQDWIFALFFKFFSVHHLAFDPHGLLDQSPSDVL
jgi:hypothetical protein